MRDFNVSCQGGIIRPTFRAEMDALACFPNDEVSLQQALLLINDEQRRQASLGPDQYKPSNLSQSVMHALNKSAGRRSICGLVALAMIAFSIRGERPSLRRAAAVVSEYANTSINLPHAFFKDGEWVERPTALLGDPSSIKAAFREYRASAHICAAKLTAADHLDLLKPFEWAGEADLCYLSTILASQQLLKEASNFENWNQWRVTIDRRLDYETYPPLLPTQSTIDAFFGPWEANGKPVD